MSFLSCNPNAFVVGNDYQLVVVCEESGICTLRVGGELFYDTVDGILRTDRCHKFILPQSVLDEAKGYSVTFAPTIEKKSYWSTHGEEQTESFSFRPLEKTEDIHAIYLADIHDMYGKAQKPAAFFGEDLDLLIMNGDFGELNKEEDFVALLRFLGTVTRGEIPLIFGRGNHDTRGKMSETLTKYIGTDNGKTYFTFALGALSGIILDCGEDKPDAQEVYGGFNCFEHFRRQELRFLESAKMEPRPYTFAICHVPFMYSAAMYGEFAIMPELYKEWGKCLNAMNPDFMICGHMHKYSFLAPNDERSLFPHDYPVVIASEWAREEGKELPRLRFAAVTWHKDETEFSYLDEDGSILKTFTCPTRRHLR